MDRWFFSDVHKGWTGYTGQIDRRLYPNSSNRRVHIWGSRAVHGEPRVVAGMATFNRLQVREMHSFLGMIYKAEPEWVILEAKGNFFDGDADGGQIADFESAVETTQTQDLRLDPDDKRIILEGHYMWFRRNGSRLKKDTPEMKGWLLSSRVITAPASVQQSGTTTPNRNDSIRPIRRERDGRCRVTGRLALDRDKPRGKDWSALHSAHVFPRGWTAESKIKQLFSKEGLKIVKEAGLHKEDLLINTILMDARVHGWFDDYRFGILPVEEDGRWYGKIVRFEHSQCDVEGQWLLAAARPSKFLRPAHGQRETNEQRKEREKDEKEREEDKTRYELTEAVLRELLKVHLETCLHWHVKGMGWDK
ncbi:hypothetical protein MSAN_02476700 [Mycena sanguinolenta]|uniref:HNH nuclease domain-containing protein n=1 Tax=Mycena sanguinolenta TaxID=230812 RepID=A0A8H6U465_9AGAR|nr:hypothetical protein MSAN_02476700 [Mycena sanguinolenta]